MPPGSPQGVTQVLVRAGGRADRGGAGGAALRGRGADLPGQPRGAAAAARERAVLEAQCEPGAAPEVGARVGVAFAAPEVVVLGGRPAPAAPGT